VEITSLAADRESHVFVSGVLHYSLEEVVREFEFIYQEGTDSLLSTEVIAADTTTVDSVLWFIRKYDADGNYLAETAGTGSGLGYGEAIAHIALSSDYLYFVDTPTNRVKINDPEGESKGIEWLEGTEITDAEERFPFLLDPSGVAADVLGFLYVSDGGNGRVLKYDGSYQYAERVDRNGADLLVAPAAVAATDSLVYVFDRSDRKVVLFELPGPPE